MRELLSASSPTTVLWPQANSTLELFQWYQFPPNLFCQMTTGMFLLVSIALALNAHDASGVIIYRIGTPFSEAEKDSLEGIGIDFRELDWSENSQLEDALDPDSLQVGVLQPNFFAEDEDIAATLLSRDGWVAVQREAGRGNFDQTVGNLLVDQDPSTAHTWKAIDQATLDFRAACCNDPGASLRVHFDLGGRFLIKEVRLRTLADRSDHFLEQFVIGVSDEIYGIVGHVPNLPTVVEVEGNTEPEVSVMLDRPVTTNFVQLRILRQTPKEIGLAAFELYGGGYVRNASYESDVIELDDIASSRRDSLVGTAGSPRPGRDPHPGRNRSAPGHFLGRPAPSSRTSSGFSKGAAI